MSELLSKFSRTTGAEPIFQVTCCPFVEVVFGILQDAGPFPHSVFIDPQQQVVCLFFGPLPSWLPYPSLRPSAACLIRLILFLRFRRRSGPLYIFYENGEVLQGVKVRQVFVLEADGREDSGILRRFVKAVDDGRNYLLGRFPFLQGLR
jgi:hypothetical protein